MIMKEFRLEIAEDMINELLECEALNIGGTIFIKKSVVVEIADRSNSVYTVFCSVAFAGSDAPLQGYTATFNSMVGRECETIKLFLNF